MQPAARARSPAASSKKPKDQGPVRELRDYVRQVHVECLHKYNPPLRRVVEMDLSRVPGRDPEKKAYLTYIEHYCPKCELTIRYPVVDFCECGARMQKAGAKPRGWRREDRDPFTGVEPEAYVCTNGACQKMVIVVDALYEPPEETE
jgi:hypothetical protein